MNSKKIRVGINGLGRIGRTLIRASAERDYNFEIVAVNNPGKPENYVHLLKYDSVHGTAKQEISYGDGILSFADQKLRFFNHKDPSDIPWSDENVDIVIDSSGVFTDKEGLSKHLER